MLAHASFLRVSTEANNINLDTALVASGAEPPIPGGAQLAAFVEAVTTAHLGDLGGVRERLVDALGPAAAERAVGVAATFQMMNRALDGVGAPVHKSLYGIGEELGFGPEDITR